MLTITWNEHELVLMPQRCVFWPGNRTLLLSDAHFGKAASFRVAGIPVPGTTDADLARLDATLHACGARRLVVLGDLLHTRSGRTVEVLDALAAWRARHGDLEIILVRGNHDRHAGDPPETLEFRCVDEPFELDGLVLCHEPPAAPVRPTMAGHVHPRVVLRARTERTRLPCFLFGSRLALLPAFGSFTGGSRVRPGAGERLYAVTPGEVIDVTAAFGRRSATGAARE